MKRVFIDSGPLIALFDASDKYHNKAVNFIKSNKYPLVTAISSVTETPDLLDFNRNVQIDFMEWIYRGAVEILNIENSDFGRLEKLTEKYRDVFMNFADSGLVYLAEKLNLNIVAIIDRDFAIFQIKGRKKFKVILSSDSFPS